MTSDPAPAPHALPVRLTVAVAIVFAVLMSLGTWQVFRLKEKEALLARIAERSHTAPKPLEQVLQRAGAGADLDFTRVSLDCPGLASAGYARVYSIDAQGQAGARLMSACPIKGAAWPAILVDRGFVADSVKRLPPTNDADMTPVKVVGVLRRPDPPNAFAPKHGAGQNLWFSRDLGQIGASLRAPAPVAPWYLAAETASNPDRPELVPAPIPTNISNRHLGYVITWYGLAAALIGVYAAMLRARRKPKP
ncbi:MAG: SURF1 family protein [Proteobacteria bacterium]|nr:SURF1 family protein [Pseudomonadota bacterium]